MQVLVVSINGPLERFLRLHLSVFAFATDKRNRSPSRGGRSEFRHVDGRNNRSCACVQMNQPAPGERDLPRHKKVDQRKPESHRHNCPLWNGGMPSSTSSSKSAG